MKLAILFFKLSWSVYLVTAIHRNSIFPYGTVNGDLTLEEGDDEISKVIRLKKPMYFYETQFSELYVATNGIISTQDLPMEKQYVDDGFPTDFPVIAPFLADIDTSNKKGSIYYRMEESPRVLNRVAQEVHRGFPGSLFMPTHTVIATWENVGAYEEVTHNTGSSNRRNTFQAVLAYDEVDTYALFLYPEDGLHFFGTRPKESYNVQLELPARVGFSRGEVAYYIFSRREGPYYSLTSTEKTVKNLYQMGNTGVPGLWLFHIGNRDSFTNVVPAAMAQPAPTAEPLGRKVEDATTPEYFEVEYTDDPFYDQSSDYSPTVSPEVEFPPPSMPELSEPARPPTQEYPSVSGGQKAEFPQGQGLPPTSGHRLSGASPPRVHPVPEARQLPDKDTSQVSSADVQPRRSPLAGSSEEAHTRVFENSPPHFSNRHVVSVEEEVGLDTEVIQYRTEEKDLCARFHQPCSPHGYCTNYSSGFCCQCQSGYYGNGQQCLPEGAPQRVNGKVNGKVSVGVTPLNLNDVDLHSYAVVGDGRAYTAVSHVPAPVGWALMPVAAIGGLFGWLFALELPRYKNGFSIAGAEFTYHAKVVFHPGNQHLDIIQTAKGLSAENYLNVDIHFNGSMPFIVPGATVHIEPYNETYHYHPSIVTSSSVREYTVVSQERGSETLSYQLHQSIKYRDCQYRPETVPETHELIVERVHAMYVEEEHVLRYAITNKIGQVTELPEPVLVNPCYSGTHDCDTSAKCLPGGGANFRCECAQGYRGDGRHCHDVDECAEELASCGTYSRCVNLPGSYHCQCQSGFEFGPDRHHCRDVDECKSQPCHSHASCTNSLGSFECRCWPGFQGDGFQCTPHSEKAVPIQRPNTLCERWRESLMDRYGGQPASHHYLPQCDSAGEFTPVQCYGHSNYCWCVDKDGREVPGTQMHDVVRPSCIPTVAPPITAQLPRPSVTPPPSGTTLLYAQGQQIGALPLNGTRLQKEKASILLALHGSIVVGIDYNCIDKNIYWTDLAGRTINRAKLEPGAEIETLINTGLISPEGLAVDELRSKMFWVDSGPDRIETSNLDGSGRRVLFDTDLVNPRAIVVDSSSGTLFWTDWNREAPKIEQSTVEGHNRRILVRDGIGLPNALAFDPSTRLVCWADAGTKRLECVASDGSGRRVIHSHLNYPFSLVTYANHFYYTDWRRDGVIALNRDTSQFTDEYLPDQRSHLYGITVVSPFCISDRVTGA